MTGRKMARRPSRQHLTDGRISDVERIEADPHAALEFEAALLIQRTNSLLYMACNARDDLTNRVVADRVGVTEGRVSQVLSGEEAPRVSTLARYMRAFGYRLEIHATPVEPEAPDFDRPAARSWVSTVYGKFADPHSGDHVVYPRVVDVGELRWERAEPVTSTGMVYLSEMRMIND